MPKFRKTIAALLAGCMVLALAACGGSSDTPAGTDTTGEETAKKEVVIVQGTNISSLDMHKATGTTTASICFNMYDSLTRADANGVVQPLLAKSWENIDDLTWQFKLEEGVKFHNGEAFNADTVKFNVERILDAEFGSPLRGDFSRIDHVDVIDDYTVNIVTTDPFPSLPLRMTYLAMEPAGYIQEVGNEGFALSPVGTGPYKFVEMVDGSHVILEKNDEYWKGAPSVEKLTFKVVAEESTRMLALENGEADIAIALPPSQVARLQDKDGVTAISAPANRIIYMAFNQITPESDNPLQDVRVRQAINYGVDQEEIIATVLEGIASTVSTPSLPQWKGYDATIEAYPHDVEKAKALLADAGYADGLSFDLSVVPGAQPAFKEVAEAVSAQLAEIGIEVNVITAESLAQRELLAAKTIQPLHISGLGGPYAENSQTLRIMLCSGERFSVNNDAEFDALFKKASSIMDEEEANKVWSEVQQMIKDRAYLVPLYQLHSIYGVSERLDWTPRLDEIVLGVEMVIK